MKRGYLIALPLLAILSCHPSPDGEEPSLTAAAKGWNLIFLSVDTLRADHLNSYGYTVRSTSPNIDSLLSKGVRFENASAPRASTWPSLTSVLSGLYPSSHGVLENGYRFPEDLLLLQDILAEAGYQTGAFLGNMCGARHRGWHKVICSVRNDRKALLEAMQWAEGLDPDQPFFLWYHQYGTHPPYRGGRTIADSLVPDYQGPIAANRAALDRVMTQDIPLNEDDVYYLNALYDGALWVSDERVGMILDWLAEKDELDRSLIVFFADHGEDLYQHNHYLYHACSVFQTGLHVPLGFIAPELLDPGAAPAQVHLVDILPTVLDLLGLPAPQGGHGSSLLPWLEDPSLPSLTPAFSEYGNTRIRTVLSDGWKLIVNPDLVSPLCFKGAPEDLYPIAPVQLYNLASDPAESQDLSTLERKRVTELQQLIEERFQDLQGLHGKQEISRELQEQLEALGYVAQ
jgi:arylsulfatase A-like enzyme